MPPTSLAPRPLALLAAFGLVGVPVATADSPMTRMRPIGAPSAIDRYTRPADPRGAAAGRFQETSASSFEQAQPASRARDDRRQPALPSTSSRTAGSTGAPLSSRSSGDGRAPVRQTVFQQSDRDPVTAPQLPGGGGMSYPGTAPPDASASPSDNQSPTAPPATSPPASAPPPSPGAPANPAGPMNPRAPASDPPSLAPPPSSGAGGDLTPLPQPQLDGGFATIDNCSCISAPSSYSAASGIDCGTVGTIPGQPPYNPPPAQIPDPAIMPSPPAAAPAPGTTGAPAGSLFTLGQELYPVQVGQGLWGQPVAYVPGQHVRNWIRYMSP